MSASADLMISNSTRPGGNGTVELPPELRFTSDSLFSVIAYSMLFLISATGNATVFSILYRNRRRKLPINRFVMHLAMADLLATFVMMPIEIFWHWTVVWKAGDVMCRLAMFGRVFGLYLSSFVLVLIAVERYLSVVRPLGLTERDKRDRNMLKGAWIASVVVSSPQVGEFGISNIYNLGPRLVETSSKLVRK